MTMKNMKKQKTLKNGKAMEKCSQQLHNNYTLKIQEPLLKISKVPDGKRTTTGMLVQGCRTLLPSIEYAGTIIKNQQSPRQKANNNWYAGTTLQNTLA